MLKNYFVIMLRSMMSQKFYTSINILCLTVGIAFAMLIGVFIAGELSVNQSLKEVDRLYLVENALAGENTDIVWFTPPPLVSTMATQFPNKIETYYRFWERNITMSKGDKHFRIQGMMGDSTFLKIFGFKVLYGNAETALQQPNSMVITESVARLFFGKTDVVNSTITVSTELNGLKEFVITAVIAEPDDKNTVSDLLDMNAQAFMLIENAKDFIPQPFSNTDNWEANSITYVKLSNGASIQELERHFNSVFQTGAPKTVTENRTIALKPISDYYLVTNHGAVMKLIVSLGIIVIFILMLAITNFMNITIASSFSRLKEVGVRKVVGSVKRQLVIQFLMESVCLALISSVLALALYQLLYPLFNLILNASLPSVLQFSILYWCWLFIGVLIIGLLAGAYPAFFQSAAKPIESLKGKARSMQGNLSFSRVLILGQFIITISIFIMSLVLAQQVNLFLDGDLGYNKSQVLIVNSVPRWWTPEGFQKMEAAHNEFLQSPKVKAVSLSWAAPGWNLGGAGRLAYAAGASKESGTLVSVSGADEHFDDVFDLTITQGYFLAENGIRQPGNVVFNEAARNALNARLGDKFKFIDYGEREFTVVGFVKDFNYEKLDMPIKPLALIHTRDDEAFRNFSFRLNTGNSTEAVSEVERLWKKGFPNEPFVYTFADEKLKALYATEVQLKRASSIATVLMLIIVMTGVLGLVSLNVSRRTKEIGIRKVLGASVTNILLMLSREYARLMLLSFILALPLAWYFSDMWLQSFVYRINLNWWMFALPGGMLLIFTTIIVTIQSYGTAVADPVKSLKYE